MKRATTARSVNRHLWLLDELRDLPTCEVRPMFGAQSCYLNELLVLVLSDKEEPWRGVLVPCEREHHAAIMSEFPSLAPHPVLPKWLYLPEAARSFERDAQAIVARIRRLDARFGIVPPAKRKAAPPKVARPARFGQPIP
ncbi:MAG: hypothetical protein IAE82_18425 [Opitutaceae bacterium]|nr:hypothetical protein [Opitutaceae bacterium]